MGYREEYEFWLEDSYFDAKTKEECEEKLAVMIEEVKKEIAAEKAKLKVQQQKLQKTSPTVVIKTTVGLACLLEYNCMDVEYGLKQKFIIVFARSTSCIFVHYHMGIDRFYQPFQPDVSSIFAHAMR